MHIFKLLQKMSKEEVKEYGMLYAADKEEFEKYFEDSWDIYEGDYLRAVIASARLLLDRPYYENPFEIPHQIHVLDFAFNKEGQNLIRNSLNRYFSNGKIVFDETGKVMSEISYIYDKTLSDYDKVIESFEKDDELQDIAEFDTEERKKVFANEETYQRIQKAEMFENAIIEKMPYSVHKPMYRGELDAMER